MSSSVQEPDAAPNSQEIAETGPPAPRPADSGTITVSTLARLLVGSALLVREVMTAAQQEEHEDPAGEAPALGEGAPDAPAAAEAGEEHGRTRLALVGMVFDTGERAARRGGAALGRARRTARVFTGPAGRWAGRSRLLAPARRRYEALVERGEVQVERWVERGRVEEARGRALVETALMQTVDTTIDQVTESPKVQELVEEQSTGLAQEVTEELRERAVSLDILVERLVGRILRRPPPRTQAPLVILQVPVEGATGAARSLAGQPAGLVSRLVAFLIDIVFISVAFVAAKWLLDAVQSVMGGGILLSRIPIPSPEAAFVSLHVSGTMLFGVGYLLLFWTASGKTPGKAVLGLRVVTRDGHRLKLGHSLLRIVGYVLSAITFYLGFLWVAVDARQRGWHDHLAGTQVVYCWDAHAEERFLAEEIQDLAAECSTDEGEQGSHTISG
jgi:uncharacterized RDD family membrane protein YckC